MSATNQVYQSLAKLIRLCDDVLLFGDKAISQENVTEVVKLVEDAVQVLLSTLIWMLYVPLILYTLIPESTGNKIWNWAL